MVTLQSLSVKARQTATDKAGQQAINIFFNNIIEKQAVNMMRIMSLFRVARDYGVEAHTQARATGC